MKVSAPIFERYHVCTIDSNLKDHTLAFGHTHILPNRLLSRDLITLLRTLYRHVYPVG